MPTLYSNIGISEGHRGHRLLWRHFVRRLDMEPFELETPPDTRWCPHSSWPANVEPPAEGSLDREQFATLVDHLAAVTAGGHSGTCVAFYAELAAGEFDELVAYRCRLDELIELYDTEDLSGSPTNIWPQDRSWFVYTDWDYWATKVSGSIELIDRLTQDGELETITLPY